MTHAYIISNVVTKVGKPHSGLGLFMQTIFWYLALQQRPLTGEYLFIYLLSSYYDVEVYSKP